MQNVERKIDEEKPQSIQTVGRIIATFSAFIIFSNGMGAIAWSNSGLEEQLNMTEDPSQTTSVNFFSYLLRHYVQIGLVMVGIGIVYLVGAIFMRRYQLWANRLVSVTSGLIILLIWGLMISMAVSIGQQEGMEIFKVGAILTAIFWSAPMGALIWFLNRGNIKKHFA